MLSQKELEAMGVVKVDIERRLISKNTPNRDYMLGRMVYNRNIKEFGLVRGYYFGQRQNNLDRPFRFKVIRKNGKETDWNENMCDIMPRNFMFKSVFNKMQFYKATEGLVHKTVTPEVSQLTIDDINKEEDTLSKYVEKSDENSKLQDARDKSAKMVDEIKGIVSSKAYGKIGLNVDIKNLFISDDSYEEGSLDRRTGSLANDINHAIGVLKDENAFNRLLTIKLKESLEGYKVNYNNIKSIVTLNERLNKYEYGKGILGRVVSYKEDLAIVVSTNCHEYSKKHASAGRMSIWAFNADTGEVSLKTVSEKSISRVGRPSTATLIKGLCGKD